MDSKRAVHFGAGNIGRGFIGPLLSRSGYHVTFVDVQDNIIDALNKEHEYSVYILDETRSEEEIRNVSGLKSNDPVVIEAIANADIVTTSVGPEILHKVAPTIAEGISKHKSGGRRELTVIACENMIGATSHLESIVREALKDREEDLMYAGEKVGFANCEVDRIVPGRPAGDDAPADPLDVGVEGFYEWIVDKKNVKGDLQVVGMQLEDNLEPFFERKLYTLNCGHAILAFIGHLKGYTTIDDAIRDEELKSITRAALSESGAALVKKHNFDHEQHEEYIEKTMKRYANPNIHDELARVSRKPMRKLSPKERLVGAINMCKEYSLPRNHLLKGVAAVFYCDVQDDEEAVSLMQLILERGIDQAVAETTKFGEDTEEHKVILKEYHEMNIWRKPSRSQPESRAETPF